MRGPRPRVTFAFCPDPVRREETDPGYLMSLLLPLLCVIPSPRTLPLSRGEFVLLGSPTCVTHPFESTDPLALEETKEPKKVKIRIE